MKRWILAAVAALVLPLAAGCSSSTQEPTRYLLRAPDGPQLAPIDPEKTLGLGYVQIAPYADRQGLMIQTGPRAVREARYHLWAEPLESGVRATVGAALSTALGREINRGLSGERRWHRRVDLRVDTLHGDLEGEARLEVRWSLWDQRSGQALAAGRFRESRSQTGSGYANLVAAQADLLVELAGRLAEAVREAEAADTD